jgi:hypothetical protein
MDEVTRIESLQLRGNTRSIEPIKTQDGPQTWQPKSSLGGVAST